MNVVALKVEFDGTDYVGWQRQPNGIAVQQRLEEALEIICGEKITVYSSGRTDAGVHARGMVAHFKPTQLLPLEAYHFGVNRKLPVDIAVRSVCKMPDIFHARYSACGKCYRYRLYLNAGRSPLHQRGWWHFKRRVDVEAMMTAAQDFVGEHDFAAFRGAGCSAKTTIRRIDSVRFNHTGDEVIIDVCGSGFLRHMVRMMVGTLVQIGAGKRPVDDVTRLLSLKDITETRLTAPAKGLCLQYVDYPEEFNLKSWSC